MDGLRRHQAKEDCAMYKCEGRIEYCQGLSNLECCWGDCKFYKSKDSFDYKQSLVDAGIIKNGSGTCEL